MGISTFLVQNCTEFKAKNLCSKNTKGGGEGGRRGALIPACLLAF